MIRPILLLVASAATAAAQPASGVADSVALSPGAPLVVAASEVSPVATRGPSGVWDGVGVALLEDIGQRTGRAVSFVGVPRDSLAAAVASGRADVALAPLAIGIEDGLDVAAVVHAEPLAVARPRQARILEVLGNLFSPTFFWIAAGLAVVLTVVGTIMWMAERKTDDDSFREGAVGVWDGFWWSGVTMTTIGYGDTVPTSPAGRSIALLWMLVSMAVTASLTASLVSALDLREGGPAALPDAVEGERVGVVAGSAAERLLAGAAADVRTVPSVAAGVDALASDSLDALVGMRAPLQAEGGADVRVSVAETATARWALVVAEESPLREPLARAALDRLGAADWPEVVRRHTASE